MNQPYLAFTFRVSQERWAHWNAVGELTRCVSSPTPERVLLRGQYSPSLLELGSWGIFVLLLPYRFFAFHHVIFPCSHLGRDQSN